MQAIAIQVIGTTFFYIISVYLSKESFGIISWVNAVSVFITTLLGFGLEQVVIRRIAASNRSNWAAAAFFIHSIIGSVITFLLLLLVSTLIKINAATSQFLPWFFAAQCLIYIGIPLKQFLNAKEKFTPYGIIAIISNSSKIIAVWFLIRSHTLDTYTVAIIMIIAAAFELICLLIYLLTKTDLHFKFRFSAYRKLLKESSAQYLSVIFDMSLSRIDWILLGILTTSTILADYSFAYRAFELAKLPMVIIAQLILPRLAKLIANKQGNSSQQLINSLNIAEMFFAMMIPLLLNILWVPVVNSITAGKYGTTNALQFFILSLCIPLQFFINLLWSLSFAAKKYKPVAGITIGCAVANIALNLVFIPKHDGVGASIAFLATTIIQAGLYYKFVYKRVMPVSIRPILLFGGIASVIYYGVISIHIHFLLQLLIAAAGYIIIAVASGQLNKQHVSNLKHFFAE